ARCKPARSRRRGPLRPPPRWRHGAPGRAAVARRAGQGGPPGTHPQVTNWGRKTLSVAPATLRARPGKPAHIAVLPAATPALGIARQVLAADRKSTRLNSSHVKI